MDELTPILQKIDREADILILGSPIYFQNVSGEMRWFFERLNYPYLTVKADAPGVPTTLLKRKISTAFIYTMGADESGINTLEGNKDRESSEAFKEIIFLKTIFGASEPLVVMGTYYNKDMSRDFQKAFEMGVRFAGTVHH